MTTTPSPTSQTRTVVLTFEVVGRDHASTLEEVLRDLLPGVRDLRVAMTDPSTLDLLLDAADVGLDGAEDAGRDPEVADRAWRVVRTLRGESTADDDVDDPGAWVREDPVRDPDVDHADDLSRDEEESPRTAPVVPEDLSPKYPRGTPEYACYAAELRLRLRLWSDPESPERVSLLLTHDEEGHLARVVNHLGSLEDLVVEVDGRQLDTRHGRRPARVFEDGRVIVETWERGDIVSTGTGWDTVAGRAVRPGETLCVVASRVEDRHSGESPEV